MKNLINLVICGLFFSFSLSASVFEFSIKRHIKEASGSSKAKIISTGNTLLDLDGKIDRLKESIDAHRGLLKTEESRLLGAGLTVSDKAEINKNIKHLKEVIQELQNQMDKQENRFSSMLVDFNTLVENK